MVTFCDSRENVEPSESCRPSDAIEPPNGVEEAQLEPLQKEARSGVGKTLIVPEPARTVRFIIRSEGPPTGGQIQVECCPTQAPGTGTGTVQIPVWRPDGGAISVTTDVGVAAVRYAGKVSGMVRASFSAPSIAGSLP